MPRIEKLLLFGKLVILAKERATYITILADLISFVHSLGTSSVANP